MGKIRRTKLNLGESLRHQSQLDEVANNFDSCLSLFIDELDVRNMAYHTKRWHRENLQAVKKALSHLNLPTEPVLLTEKMVKQCILYWKREKNHSVTSINHRVRSLKQFLMFLNHEGVVNGFTINEIGKLKAPKLLIKPFEETDLRILLAQPDKSTFVGFRDYTMMLVFLDTGVRLIEMENMMVSNVFLNQNKILVFGKGAKEREVMFQSKTKEFLHRYLLIRGTLDHDYLWITDRNTLMKRRNIGERLTIYGKMAGLSHVRVSIMIPENKTDKTVQIS